MLYQSAQLFVLPTRGEGWCLPCVEAMAIGLPVIVTNFSGPTEYMAERHSYPLNINPGYTASGTVEPNTSHLVELMLHVDQNREEARERGLLARKHVRANYHPEIVAQLILDRLSSLISS